MAHMCFHGPNNSNECRKQLRALKKEFGGKFSYNSFFNARRMQWHDGWHSEGTRGKAAYSLHGVPLQLSKYYHNAVDRKKGAAIIRDLRKRKFTGGLKFHFFY